MVLERRRRDVERTPLDGGLGDADLGRPDRPVRCDDCACVLARVAHQEVGVPTGAGGIDVREHRGGREFGEQDSIAEHRGHVGILGRQPFTDRGDCGLGWLSARFESESVVLDHLAQRRRGDHHHLVTRLHRGAQEAGQRQPVPRTAERAGRQESHDEPLAQSSRCRRRWSAVWVRLAQRGSAQNRREPLRVTS